jgi:TIR domain
MEQERVFLSYRRTDDRHLAGRLRDVLSREFGEANVFFDVDNIPAGQDFRVALRDQLVTVDVLISLIGPNWEPARLSRSNDFVRLELVEAFRQGTPVVPVLIDTTPMPSTDELPDELEGLAFLQALVIRPDPDFRNDASRVARSVRAAIERSRAEKREAEARQAESQTKAELTRSISEGSRAEESNLRAELSRLQTERQAAEAARTEAESELARLRAQAQAQPPAPAPAPAPAIVPPTSGESTVPGEDANPPVGSKPSPQPAAFDAPATSGSPSTGKGGPEHPPLVSNVTSHAAPQDLPPPAFSQGIPVQQNARIPTTSVSRTSTHKLAKASVVLGIVGLVTFPAIVVPLAAIVLGWMSVSRARTDANSHALRLGRIGWILGSVGIALFVVFLIIGLLSGD